MAEIQIDQITKRYPGTVALDDVSLTIHNEEFMVLLGPSGCGKTTLLRLIAGFEQPDEGAILIDGRDVTEMPPGKRGLAMVFQSYALFPHLRVFDNIAFGLRMHHVSGPDIKRRVDGAAELMQITRLLDRYPTQLSGGQRQRVAVARALVMEPAVILMDEPLSNLDALLRLQMRAELKRLLQEARTTTVYVTHDQIEALSMGDRTAVMRDGRILQVDTPMMVYDRPGDVFVAQFIGTPPMNVLHGRMGERQVEVEGHVLAVGVQDGFRPGDDVMVGVRAENIEVSHDRSEGAVPAEVGVVEPLGSHLLLTLALGAQSVKVATRTDFQVKPRDQVWLRPEQGALRLLGGPDGEG
ncbi:MAG TPA: ABC transporter ATP-binding protein [Candidatus Dormibacteraeota bacterium]|nr:ABC transporter ATP-binding protein [Candidatus Dormibacteraeota bacterium]